MGFKAILIRIISLPVFINILDMRDDQKENRISLTKTDDDKIFYGTRLTNEKTHNSAP